MAAIKSVMQELLDIRGSKFGEFYDRVSFLLAFAEAILQTPEGEAEFRRFSEQRGK